MFDPRDTTSQEKRDQVYYRLNEKLLLVPVVLFVEVLDESPSEKLLNLLVSSPFKQKVRLISLLIKIKAEIMNFFDQNSQVHLRFLTRYSAEAFEDWIKALDPSGDTFKIIANSQKIIMSFESEPFVPPQPEATHMQSSQ